MILSLASKSKLKTLFIMLMLFSLTACSLTGVQQRTATQPITSTGKWIIETDGSTMLDPQTSGLTFYENMLLSVSDGSAHESQIQRLHQLSPNTGEVINKLGPIVLSERTQQSCFADYLSQRPDYEAIVAVPNTPNTWLLVTEDATRSGNYSTACKQKFKQTGSTEHPSLLVQITLINGQLVLTGVRALQFEVADKVGNFPNDGLEGMTITRDGRILVGLEKDAKVHPRVFELAYTNDMFNTLDAFLPVVDSKLWLPDMGEGNHPINGMDVFYPANSDNGFLILAARNDNQLWIVDLQKQIPTQIIDMVFSSPCDDWLDTEKHYELANTSLEGVAVHNNTLYLINDPWKKVYRSNTNLQKCPSDKVKYDAMSPLLFRIDIPTCFASGNCS